MQPDVPSAPLTFDTARNRLWDELVHLHDTWEQYRKLYGHSEDRVKLLNSSARSFFALLQRLMVRDVILGISRLTDPPKSKGKSNLVLSVLLEDPRLTDRPELKAELASGINEAKRLAQPVREHRNRYIAHLDHATAIGAPDDPLPPIPGSSVDELITRMESVYHRYRGELDATDSSFELSTLGGFDSLLRVLEDAERWREHDTVERRRRYGLDSDENGAA